MPQTHTITTYQFSELSDEAQKKALDTCRDWNVDDSYWYETIIEDAKETAALMGLEVDNIYFSGFWSQGDGASFTGNYSYRKGSVKAVKEHAPQDTELHRIAADLAAHQSRYFYGLSASISANDRYHTLHVEIDSEHVTLPWAAFDDTSACETAHDGISEPLKDFAHWIYRDLERSYEYLISDDAVREAIESNEIEFTETGARY